tara:strand:+ start:177 stop:431 length:255 start_codon:yes stop_codon:yes gene_type:complete
MKLFNKLRKKRIRNKINKLTSKREELQGIPQGYFEQPAWDEGGKEVVNITIKMNKLKEKLEKLNKKSCGGGMMCGGAVGPNGIL